MCGYFESDEITKANNRLVVNNNRPIPIVISISVRLHIIKSCPLGTIALATFEREKNISFEHRL